MDIVQQNTDQSQNYLPKHILLHMSPKYEETAIEASLLRFLCGATGYEI
jgi:hypothetical protein